MELTTLIGLVSAVALTIIGILWGGGDMMGFVDLPSIVIVIGGSLATCFVGFSMKEVANLPKTLSLLFAPPKLDPKQAVTQIITLANLARKEGLLALEEASKDLGDAFLQKGVMLIVDGTDPELVKGILEAEVGSLESRHGRSVALLDHLAGMAPAFGMIGTLIGLITMLGNLSDPDALGPGMAVALVTTFYGSLLANVFFAPMAGKLKNMTVQEIAYKEMLLEGMLSIQAGENPRIIEEKLFSFLPRDARTPAAPAAGAGEET